MKAKAKTLELTDKGREAEVIIRTAAKPQRCRFNKTRGGLQPSRAWDSGPLPADHVEEIPRGADHVEYLGESPAFSSGYRYCAGCSVAAGLVRRVSA